MPRRCHGTIARHARRPARARPVQGEWQQTEHARPQSNGDQGILAPRQLFQSALALCRGDAPHQFAAQVFFVAVVVRPAQPGGELPQRRGVLARLVAGDELAGLDVADPRHDHVVDGGRQLGHAGGGNRIAVADDHERRAARPPRLGDLGRFLQPGENVGRSRAKCKLHRQLGQDIANHLQVGRVDDDRLGASVGGDDGRAEAFHRRPLEERFQQVGGALRPALLARRPGILEAHARRHVQHQQQLAKLVLRDEVRLVDLWLNLQQRQQAPSEGRQRRHAQGRRGKRPRRRSPMRAKGQRRHPADPPRMQPLRRDGEDEDDQCGRFGYHGVTLSPNDASMLVPSRTSPATQYG